MKSLISSFIFPKGLQNVGNRQITGVWNKAFSLHILCTIQPRGVSLLINDVLVRISQHDKVRKAPKSAIIHYTHVFITAFGAQAGQTGVKVVR